MNPTINPPAAHRIPEKYLKDTVFLRSIYQNQLKAKGYISQENVVIEIIERIKNEKNTILADIYKQTLNYLTQQAK